MLKEGLVSIITPAYNSGKYISETIESVLKQTYSNWEMIIINDSSKDDTLNIINRYAKQENRIKVINLVTNGGAANAWNQGFKVMQGEFLSFIDSDDLWVEDKLEKQITYIKTNGYAFVYSSYEWIDAESKPLNKVVRSKKTISYNQMIRKNDIGLLTVMIDLKKIKINQIDRVNMAWDFLLWTNIMKTGVLAYGMDDILGKYRILSNSASRNKKKAAKGVWEIYKNQLGFSLVKRLYYFTQYMFISIKRYYIE